MLIFDTFPSCFRFWFCCFEVGSAILVVLFNSFWLYFRCLRGRGVPQLCPGRLDSYFRFLMFSSLALKFVAEVILRIFFDGWFEPSVMLIFDALPSRFRFWIDVPFSRSRRDRRNISFAFSTGLWCDVCVAESAASS